MRGYEFITEAAKVIKMEFGKQGPYNAYVSPNHEELKSLLRKYGELRGTTFSGNGKDYIVVWPAEMENHTYNDEELEEAGIPTSHTKFWFFISGLLNTGSPTWKSKIIQVPDSEMKWAASSPSGVEAGFNAARATPRFMKMLGYKPNTLKEYKVIHMNRGKAFINPTHQQLKGLLDTHHELRGSIHKTNDDRYYNVLWPAYDASHGQYASELSNELNASYMISLFISKLENSESPTWDADLQPIPGSDIRWSAHAGGSDKVGREKALQIPKFVKMMGLDRLNEYKIVDIPYKTYSNKTSEGKVIMNPTHNEVKELLDKHGELRGSAIERPNNKLAIFVWPAKDAGHITYSDSLIEIYGDDDARNYYVGFFLSSLDESGSPTWDHQLKDAPSGIKYSGYRVSVEDGIHRIERHPRFQKLLGLDG